VDKTESRLSSIVDNVKHPLESETYRLKCKETLDKEGVLVLKGLLHPNIIQKIFEGGRKSGTFSIFLRK